MMGGRRKRELKPCFECVEKGETNRNGKPNVESVGGRCVRHTRIFKYGPALVEPYGFKWLEDDGYVDEVAAKRIAFGASADLPIICTKEEAIKATMIILSADPEGPGRRVLAERVGCSIHMAESLLGIARKRIRRAVK
jgi:hypothetical protein